METRPVLDGKVGRGGHWLKATLLALLGLLWAVRIAAIKAAGLSGVPVHVVVTVTTLGLAVVFTIRAFVLADWPSIGRSLAAFYGLTAAFGFLLPFALESYVAPQLPVFVFVVVIATMPIMALTLSFLTGVEQVTWRSVAAVALGFVCAIAILWDTASAIEGTGDSWWVIAALGVPLLYAFNTVFVAKHWPARTGAVHVAHAQALIVGAAALVGSLAGNALPEISLVARAPWALVLIVVGEALALLVYLRITRDYGATWVSFANYVSMIFGAIIGGLFFGDSISVFTVVAAFGIVASISLYERRVA